MKEQMKKVAKKAVTKHEQEMHKNAKKMAMGGKPMGRGMTKMKTQRSR